MRGCDARTLAARDDRNGRGDGDETEALARNANFDLPRCPGSGSKNLNDRIDQRDDVVRRNEDDRALDRIGVESIGTAGREDQFRLHGIAAVVGQAQPTDGIRHDERARGNVERCRASATDRDSIIVLNQQSRRRAIFRANGEIGVARQRRSTGCERPLRQELECATRSRGDRLRVPVLFRNQPDIGTDFRGQLHRRAAGISNRDVAAGPVRVIVSAERRECYVIAGRPIDDELRRGRRPTADFQIHEGIRRHSQGLRDANGEDDALIRPGHVVRRPAVLNRERARNARLQCDERATLGDAEERTRAG